MVKFELPKDLSRPDSGGGWGSIGASLRSFATRVLDPGTAHDEKLTELADLVLNNSDQHVRSKALSALLKELDSGHMMLLHSAKGNNGVDGYFQSLKPYLEKMLMSSDEAVVCRTLRYMNGKECGCFQELSARFACNPSFIICADAVRNLGQYQNSSALDSIVDALQHKVRIAERDPEHRDLSFFASVLRALRLHSDHDYGYESPRKDEHAKVLAGQSQLYELILGALPSLSRDANSRAAREINEFRSPDMIADLNQQRSLSEGFNYPLLDLAVVNPMHEYVVQCKLLALYCLKHASVVLARELVDSRPLITG